MDAPSRTPQGGLRVPASLTRAGVFEYVQDDGSVRKEYRSPAEVFKADSLASLISAPVTDEHPSVPVRTDNFSQYARGHVGENIVRNGGRVSATLYVQDDRLIAAIERGDKREVSCGYTCDVLEQPGVVPDGELDAGQKYDALQQNIAYNHVAAVPMGRAGSTVRMHLDANGHQLMPRIDAGEQTRMDSKPTRIERLDSVDYIVDSEEHKAAIKFRADLEIARADKAKAEANAVAAEAKAKELQGKLDAAVDTSKLDELVAARAALLESARKVLGAEAKLDGKTEAQIKAEVVAKAYPDEKLDGQHPAFVDGLYKAALKKDASSDLVRVRQRGDATGTEQHRDAVSEYARAIEETESAGRTMWHPMEPA